MRNDPSNRVTRNRTLAVLEAVVADSGHSSLSALARLLDIPVPTVHRQADALVRNGYLQRAGRGQYIAGPALLRLNASVDHKQIMALLAEPLVHQLSARIGAVAQLGILENDMVTYLLKTGRGAGDLFTQTGMQLEAYCSGIGKVLLAYLPKPEREAYLANGPFVPLTRQTITDCDQLRVALQKVRAGGFATDDREVADDLSCLAVPIFSSSNDIIAAISVTRSVSSTPEWDQSEILALLQKTATAVGARLQEAAIG